MEELTKNQKLTKDTLFNATENNECYTTKESIDELKKIIDPYNKVIWCPFDKEESEFVKWLKQDNEVIYSHIDFGQDFYKWTPDREYDFIISNPPYKHKRMIIDRCLELGKPFCLLFGATICSQSCGNTLNKCDLWFIQKSLTFTTAGGGKKKFQCLLVMSKDFKERYFKHGLQRLS